MPTKRKKGLHLEVEGNERGISQWNVTQETGFKVQSLLVLFLDLSLVLILVFTYCFFVGVWLSLDTKTTWQGLEKDCDLG